MMFPAASSAIALMVRSRRAQVVFERHVGRELGGEAAVTRRHLALEARERMFFLGLRVQEDRESRGPTGMKPARSSSAGVAPTTTQSRSDTARPSSRSRTAPPTKYTCMARMLTEFAQRS